MNIDNLIAGTKPARTYKVKSPSRGGARANSGRPKGSTNKYTLDGLMGALETATGQPFAKQIAANYAAALERGDYAGVRDYDRVLLGKLVADKQQVETVNGEDVVEAKRTAFADALKALSNVPAETDTVKPLTRRAG